uniref:Uncharacterized protein n=1 Tax=Kalanchoe fedtschenkoi TaxID=63787 RepID=A0A7N0T355_KALFE
MRYTILITSNKHKKVKEARPINYTKIISLLHRTSWVFFEGCSMFYSHQILARKGPLATVWIAAHLQHRLKKPHYNSVDITSTVDRIIFPEAPIALRMSGHLLLGVVRIYSKKVDYLYHDCNDAMVKVSKAFAPTHVNLTDAAASAPPDDVTLPERFELDALKLDDFTFTERDVDIYIRSPEDITLPDPTPLNMDHYVAITFEDIDMTPSGDYVHGLDGVRERDTPQPAGADGTDSSGRAGSGNGTELPSEGLHGVSSSAVQPMEEDIRPVQLVNIGEYQPEATTERTHEHQSPQSIEVMRHAALDFTVPDLPLPNQRADEAAQEKAELSDKDREYVSPLGEELLESGEQPPSFQPQIEQVEIAASEESPNLLASRLSLGQSSLQFSVKSTPLVPQVHAPPVEVAQRRRKRKLYDEKSIVLSNKALKAALNDTSKILRKKRRLPDTFLGSWKLERIIRKEHIFTEPLLTGMCEDLHAVYMDLSAKPYFAITEEPLQERRDQHAPDVVPQPDVTPSIVAQQVEGERGDDFPDIPTEQGDDYLGSEEVQAAPPDREPEKSPRETRDFGSAHEGEGEETPVSPTELDMEIERLRKHEGDVGTSFIPEFTPTAALRSRARQDDIPTVSAGSFELGQEPESTLGPRLFLTPDLALSAETHGTEALATSDRHQIEQPAFSDLPELMKSPGTEELHFLEADSSLSGLQGTQDVNSLSVRTRAVAQYLKGLSPASLTPDEQSATLSLNDILENKSRKLCARMFYETLVLKSFDLIDVVQNESYGDITLKLTSALKAQL